MKNIIFVHKEFYHKIQVSVKEQMVFCRKIALNNFAIVTKKILVLVSIFLIKMQAFRPTTLSKLDSSKSVFL